MQHDVYVYVQNDLKLSEFKWSHDLILNRSRNWFYVCNIHRAEQTLIGAVCTEQTIIFILVQPSEVR